MDKDDTEQHQNPNPDQEIPIEQQQPATDNNDQITENEPEGTSDTLGQMQQQQGFVAQKLFDFNDIMDPVKFSAMLNHPTRFRPAKTEYVRGDYNYTVCKTTPLVFTPSYMNLLLSDFKGTGPRLTSAQVKRKVMEAAAGQPFSHVKDAEQVKMCMQKFSKPAIVAMQTLRENHDFDTANYDEQQRQVYLGHTYETLRATADYFGEATAELSGYLFVPTQSL